MFACDIHPDSKRGMVGGHKGKFISHNFQPQKGMCKLNKNQGITFLYVTSVCGVLYSYTLDITIFFILLCIDRF